MRFFGVGTLRRRIQLLLLVTLVPVFILILANAYAAAQREKTDIQQQAVRLATSVSVNHEQLFNSAARLLELLSAMDIDAAALCAQIRTVAPIYPNLANVALVDRDGRVHCDTRSGADAATLPREWLATALAADRFAVSGFQQIAIAPQPTVLVGRRYPALPDAVVVAAIDLDFMVRQMEAVPLPPQSSVAVVGADRIVVARVPDNASFRGRPSTSGILDQIAAQDDGIFETTAADGVRRLYGFRRLDLPGKPLLVTLGIPVAIAYQEANRRLWSSLAVLGVVTVAAFLFARHLSVQLFERKIESVLRAARSLSAGDLDARTGEEWTPDEIGELARAFDAMAWALQQRTLDLERSIASLRALAGRLESVREEERTRISREIHDELGQSLTGIRMDLDRLETRVREARLGEEAAAPILAKLASARGLVDGAGETARRISRQLRPSVLDVLGFRAAVEWQLDDFRQRTGVDTELLAPDELPELDEARTVALFRVLQETLTNVMRHSQATAVTVRLAHEDDGAVLEVMDNGRGFDAAAGAPADRLGLLGMRERVTALHGTLAIDSAPGRGTTITVHLPLDAAAVSA